MVADAKKEPHRLGGVLLQFDMGVEILLLKVGCGGDFFFRKMLPRRHDNPFVFYIIVSVDDGDDSSGELIHGNIDTQDIGILFFTILCVNACNIDLDGKDESCPGVYQQ